MTKPAPAQEWVCVPRRPDVSMCKAAQRFDTESENVTGDDAASIYTDMLAAAPDSGMVAVPKEHVRFTQRLAP